MAADPLASLGASLERMVREIVRAELAKHRCPAPAPATGSGPVLLTMAGAARRAGVGRTTLARWIAAGLATVALPGRVEGREIRRVSAHDLDRWIDVNGRRNRGGAAARNHELPGAGRRAGAVPTADQPTSLHEAVMRRAGTPVASRRRRGKAGAGAAS